MGGLGVGKGGGAKRSCKMQSMPRLGGTEYWEKRGMTGDYEQVIVTCYEWDWGVGGWGNKRLGVCVYVCGILSGSSDQNSNRFQIDRYMSKIMHR